MSIEWPVKFVQEASVHTLSLEVLSRTLPVALWSLKAGEDTKSAEILTIIRQGICT